MAVVWLPATYVASRQLDHFLNERIKLHRKRFTDGSAEQRGSTGVSRGRARSGGSLERSRRSRLRRPTRPAYCLSLSALWFQQRDATNTLLLQGLARTQLGAACTDGAPASL